MALMALKCNPCIHLSESVVDAPPQIVPLYNRLIEDPEHPVA